MLGVHEKHVEEPDRFPRPYAPKPHTSRCRPRLLLFPRPSALANSGDTRIGPGSLPLMLLDAPPITSQTAGTPAGTGGDAMLSWGRTLALRMLHDCGADLPAGTHHTWQGCGVSRFHHVTPNCAHNL